MKDTVSTLTILLASTGLTFASPVVGRGGHSVVLDSATVTGLTVGPVTKYLGIPFAQPPTGNLRFQLPQSLPAYNESFSAIEYGPACPQQIYTVPYIQELPQEVIDYLVDNVYSAILPSAEDCLTLNVVTPTGSTPESELPVVVWIFGGAFEFGGTSSYDGGIIVGQSIALGVPAIYVSMNYRVNAFGFLASQEVKDAGLGNFGLQDQRLALRWVQKYISAFGGDPTKVTIWGESAGAISAALQMVTNGGDAEGLFRAAFMQSGSPIPVGDITHGQKYYDAIVDETGCSGSPDTLQCLREVPYDILLGAVNKSPSISSYQSLKLAWLPRVDGVFLMDDPQHLVQQGSVANIPFISGDCDDEGTVFALTAINVTTDSQLEEYLQTEWLPASAIQQLLQLYPADVTQGSPFDTGNLNALTPQFKRMAAIEGDAIFQSARRLFLQNQSGKQNIWTFLSKRLKAIPFLGSFHASDVLNVYGGGDMASYLVRFVANLDPNGGIDINWPKYTAQQPNMLEFSDGLITQTISQDTYRAEPIAFLIDLLLSYPL
ncbi:Alpha/Beta hydrolase protein [Phlebopus sp. FC_14]|nr:Alpha/Beta hydrolase protein [Phlebopus sp. FC_14]